MRLTENPPEEWSIPEIDTSDFIDLTMTPTAPVVSEDGEESYRGKKGISQSELKLLAYNPQTFFEPKKKRKSKEHFLIGSLVDVLHTNKEQFDNIYKIVPNEIKPKGQMLELVEYLIEYGLEDSDENLILAQAAVKFNPGWGLAAVKKWYLATGQKYYEEIFRNTEKIVIDDDQYSKVCMIMQSLKTNEFTQEICNENTNSNVERVYQMELYFYKQVENPATNQFEEILCKSCLDIVDFDHLNQTVQIYDLKTTGKSTRQFPESMRAFRYDIQGASYLYGMLQYTKGKATSNVDIFAVNYTVLPFKFIVETTNMELIGTPMIYELSATDVTCGMFGVNFPSKACPASLSNNLAMPVPSIPGWVTLLQQYLWHTTTGIYNYKPPEWHELQGPTRAISSRIW